MADNGRWFKLWCSALHDPDLDNLDISDFGRWCKLGALIKEQGIRGCLKFKSPARILCSLLQIDTFDDLISCIKRLPNVSFEEGKNDNGTNSVIIKNWSKYQVDSTRYERLKRWRNKQNDNGVRGEEKRGEEKRGEKEEKKKGVQSVALGTDFVWEISEDLKAKWKAAYPSVPLEIELKKAAAWAQANPARRKKNWEAFLVRWLSKTQERGSWSPEDVRARFLQGES